eukprot:15449726-Alexandrium_andersonii.AAC.1
MSSWQQSWQHDVAGVCGHCRCFIIAVVAQCACSRVAGRWPVALRSLMESVEIASVAAPTPDAAAWAEFTSPASKPTD